jgi:redox-sensitive bicupin YhaK (pirin superfamily)
MSIYAEHPKDAKEVNEPCKGIQRLLEARITELGGFSVRRVLPSSHQHMIGPWIFFDHFGPTEFQASKGVDIRPHPHINMATVTYLFEGAMLHQDSTGAVQTIVPGSVNVMFAGKGIVHSERTPMDVRQHTHKIHGLQLWLAMPEAIEQDDPHFYHFGAEEVPKFEVGEVKGRVLMGQAYGVSSPVKVFSPTLYFEAFIPKGSTLKAPSDATEIGVYLVSGKVANKETIIETGTMAVSTHHDGIEITALEDSQIVVIGGEPVGERYIWWNFVSSDLARIKQAAFDWEEGLFPEIPTDHEEHIFIPADRPMPKE